jgi:ankyrin repeat protein
MKKMIQSIFIFLLFTIFIFAAENPNTIFQAIASDDDVMILNILRNDLDNKILNIIGPGGQTPLMNAVLSGKVKAVTVLLEAGADTSIPEQDGYTPMVRKYYQFQEFYTFYDLYIYVAWSWLSRSS